MSGCGAEAPGLISDGVGHVGITGLKPRAPCMCKHELHNTHINNDILHVHMHACIQTSECSEYPRGKTVHRSSSAIISRHGYGVDDDAAAGGFILIV